MRLFSILFVYLVFSAPILAQNAQTEPLRTISVMGQAELEVAPDQARFYVGARDTQKTAAVAVENVTKISNDIVKILTAAGIAEEDITTHQVQISIRYRDNSQRLLGTADSYEAYVRTSVLARDLSVLPDVLTNLSQSGANDLGGLNFEISNRDEVEEQAMLLAVDDAMGRASKLAERAGMNLAKPVQIEYGHTNFDAPVLYEAAASRMALSSADEDSSLAISAGTIRVSSDVSMQFEMLP